jgi:hypothetical protein
MATGLNGGKQWMCREAPAKGCQAQAEQRQGDVKSTIE